MLHIVAVPAFISATLWLVGSVATLNPVGALTALVGMLVAFGAQGFVHGREQSPSIPFDGPADAVARVFAEQFVTFPRFVLGGGWWRAFHGG